MKEALEPFTPLAKFSDPVLDERMAISLDDTIAALATPIGEGGIAVVRVSGPRALAIVDRIFRPAGVRNKKPSEAESHTVHYGHIFWEGRVVDEVLITVLLSPRTFTREDTVEISCHGGALTSKLTLETTLAAGARLAQPGEFTQRAFLNGRLDLTQAEAVADIIHARTELSLKAANEQLAGKLSKRVEALREDLMLVMAHVEAHIDFPDEDIAPDTQNQLLIKLRKGALFVDELLKTAREGRILRNGVRCAIIGRPNAGKSSLLNQLLGHDRAIVSETEGTTRDTIEETASVRGIPIIFVDTAGIRESKDAIETEGIRRSRNAVDQSEIVLHIIDASAELHPMDIGFLEEFKSKKRILALNKVDLPQRVSKASLQTQDKTIDISAVTGSGLEELKDQLSAMIWEGQVQSENLEIAISARHQTALMRAGEGLQRSEQALSMDESLELVAMDLRIAVEAIGEIVGRTSTEDLLDKIFSQFCIGK